MTRLLKKDGVCLMVAGERSKRPVWDHSEFTNTTGKIEFTEEGAAFVPGSLPPSIDYDREIFALMVKAERSIAELKGMGREMDYLHPAIGLGLKREAVLSSRIEGTTASLGDLNLHEAVGEPIKGSAEARRLPEVVNCAKALKDALASMQAPGSRLDLDTLRTAHKTLMVGVGEYDMNPGQFRTRQNWIVGRKGRELKISYTPPPPGKVPKLLDNLAEFMQFGDDPSAYPLVQCAVAHYQFEAIHPFPDGNGRVGRLLIPLMLHKNGLMPKPLLYPSAYFEKHRQEYYKALLEVSKTGKWRRWIAFFLRALGQQADEAMGLVSRLAFLEEEYTKDLTGRNVRASAMTLMKELIYNPYTTIPRAAKRLSITYPTAKAAVASLVEVGILEEAGKRRRNRVFYARGIDEALADDGQGTAA